MSSDNKYQIEIDEYILMFAMCCLRKIEIVLMLLRNLTKSIQEGCR